MSTVTIRKRVAIAVSAALSRLCGKLHSRHCNSILPVVHAGANSCGSASRLASCVCHITCVLIPCCTCPPQQPRNVADSPTPCTFINRIVKVSAMSEKHEHASKQTEAQEEEQPIEKSGERLKNETELTASRSETDMLEDEEMPTYISVSTPSRNEESSANHAKPSDRIPMEEDHSRSPYPSDDQGGGSVYVLSSGEESDRPPYNDEDDDEYADTEDMDDMDLENERGQAMMDEEEEDDEDEDDDHPLRIHSDDEEIDGEMDPECFERVSDDYILSNRPKHYNKKRRLSLQDLSVCKNNFSTTYDGKRRSLDIPRSNYVTVCQNYMIYPESYRKPAVTSRYRHVESKVKQYIKDIKEQSRRSIDKRVKEDLYLENKNAIDGSDINNEQSKSIPPHKNIKGYVERVIKDLEIEESCKDDKEAYNKENGQDDKVVKLTEEQPNCVQKDVPMDVHDEANSKDKDVRNVEEKRNGSIGQNMQNYNSYRPGYENNIRFNDIDESCLVNGHQQTPTVFNLRTLSYEEYMHGSSNSSQKAELKRVTHTIPESNETVTYTEAEVISVPDVDSSNNACPLKIENVKSIGTMSEESKDYSENINFGKTNQGTDKQRSENIEIASLKAQLSQKSAQFNNLQDTYQKVLTEYIKMKQEMDGLKKNLAMHEKKNQPCETRGVAVQTDSVGEPILNNDETTEVKQSSTNKKSTSSVASTISSVNHWTDSLGSPAISMDPPDIKGLMNSDDSMIISDGTPRNRGRRLSHTFITSSRILQTLSNITQRKNKPESNLAYKPMTRLNETPNRDHAKKNDSAVMSDSTDTMPSSAKKRKATDILETLISQHPFKIPHTNGGSRKRSSSASNAATEATYSGHSVNTKPLHSNANHCDESQSQASMSVEDKQDDSEEITDLEGNVKCFVYKEDENSKDHSFLIQAEEPKTENGANEKIRIRECGPYLLGNMEVRMSEVNGTINIWGKEISQDSVTEYEDEINISTRSSDMNPLHCCHKTPQTRFNGSQIVCSTNKKSKIPPKFNAPNISQCSSSPFNNIKTTLLGGNLNAKQNQNRSLSPTRHVYSSERCDSPKQCRECSEYRQASTSHEKSHSCCSPRIESLERDRSCSCNQGVQNYEETVNSSKERLGNKANRRFSCRSANELNKQTHENVINPTVEFSETICRHHTTCCHSSIHNVNEYCQEDIKYCNAARNNLHVCKSSLMSNPECSSGMHTCNRSPSHNGEEDPLIPLKHSIETPETRQRRLSGKKVRGILMDLLRGCGDCRTSSSVSGPKCGVHNKERSFQPPQIKISRCNSPEPSCSTTHQSGNRCCHAYVHSIESQLEELQLEMEKTRSRSEAILDMLKKLHSVDAN